MRGKAICYKQREWLIFKILKTSAKSLDKGASVWYSKQAVRAGSREGNTKIQEAEKSVDKRNGM